MRQTYHNFALSRRAFDLAWEESVGTGSYEKRMRLQSFGAIVPGEFTLVFLHEPDLNVVHYGLVTSGPRGRLEVRDPAAAARQAGDEKAAQAWEQGFAAKEGARRTKQYMLLDAAAVEKMQAASMSLAQNPNMYGLSSFLEECKADRTTEQDTKVEYGCKRPKSEGSDDCQAEPEVKRVKREPS